VRFPPAYQLVVTATVAAKLWAKHQVSPGEAREAFELREPPRRDGTSPRGNRVYLMHGRTYDGRRLFLAVERVPGSPIRAILRTAFEPD
jgi:hypothetical protein